MTPPWSHPVQICHTGYKLTDLGPSLLLCRSKLYLKMALLNHNSQDSGHFGNITGECCKLTQQPQKSQSYFLWLYSMTRIHRPIFQRFLFFFFWKSNKKNWLLLLEQNGSSNWRNCVSHHPLPQSYSTAFLHPHFISGGENNSPITDLPRNQSGRHRFIHWSATSTCPLWLRSVKDTRIRED